MSACRGEYAVRVAVVFFLIERNTTTPTKGPKNEGGNAARRSTKQQWAVAAGGWCSFPCRTCTIFVRARPKRPKTQFSIKTRPLGRCAVYLRYPAERGEASEVKPAVLYRQGVAGVRLVIKMCI